MTGPNGTPVVGIDASRMHVHERTGTENYSDQLIRSLLAEDVPWCWRLYLNGPTAESPVKGNDRVDIRGIPARRLWTHYRLSRDILTHRPDLLFVPAHVVPLIHPRTVVTIHDLGYLHVPEAHPADQRRMLDLTTRWSARVAHHIIVPSAQTRDDLVRFYRIAEDKISVVHHGVRPRFGKDLPTRAAAIRNCYGLRRPYVLAVGTIQPRKDLPTLARAMTMAGDEHDLVIAGKRGWMADQVLAELDAAGLGGRLRLLGYVPDEDLPGLYAAASVFVQPSRFEGFGMPVLEAMSAGTPVLSASGSSLVEIAGDAAIFFTGGDHAELAGHLDLLLRDPDLQARIRDQGITWSRGFTWDRAARETRSILQEALA